MKARIALISASLGLLLLVLTVNAIPAQGFIVPIESPIVPTATPAPTDSPLPPPPTPVTRIGLPWAEAASTAFLPVVRQGGKVIYRVYLPEVKR